MNELGAKAVPLPVFFRIPVLQTVETSRCRAQPACAKLEIHPRRGWVNRPSTFHVTSKAPIFKHDFVVTVGGREVNASRLSDHVAQLTLPPWIETFDYEAAVDLDKDNRYKANVVVTNGTGVYVSDKSGYFGHDKGEEGFDIEFTYYAPTPLTAVGGGPMVETVPQVPTARFTDGAQEIDLDEKDDTKRHIRITLSRTLKPVSAELILRDKEPPIVAEMVVNGRDVRTKNPLEYKYAPAQSKPKNLDKEVVGKPLGGLVLKLEFSDKSVWRLPVTGNLTLHKSR
ncbi:MAG TPA: hypothetical protein VMZ31_00675 [Phycisphaerae bacterium]|nr:hypothetical protein [Phycisphaerae bacterium]